MARSILGNRTVERWYPLLFFRGKMKGNDLRTLQTRTVSYGGKRKLIDRIGCGFPPSGLPEPAIAFNSTNYVISRRHDHA